jgi:hypothetical protein
MPHVQIITLPPVNTDEKAASYVASSRAECRDDTDRSAFDMALLTGQQVTCGKVIARPFRPVRRSFEEVREAFRTGDASTEELAAAAERGRQTYPGDPHAARVYAAMLEIDRDDDDVEWVNTGGNMMCLESLIDGRRVLVGEGATAPDGFGWCVESPCDGCCGVNYEIAINTSNWGVAQIVTALRAILENPTPTPLTIDLTGRGDFYNVAESEY